MKAPRGLLDTNVVIHLPALPADRLPTEAAISSITLAELSAGPLATADLEERAIRQARLQRTEAAFETLPFDAQAARRYGAVSAAVMSAGRTPRRRFADLLIACVAMANDLPLYTANPQDFAGLERLLAVVPVLRPERTEPR